MIMTHYNNGSVRHGLVPETEANMKCCRITTAVLFCTIFVIQNAWAFFDDKAAPADWGTTLKNVSLTWVPKRTVTRFDPIDTTVFQNAKITVRPFTDSRNNPSEIGRNVERHPSGLNRLVTTKDSVPPWLTERFISVLREFRVDVAKDNGAVILEAVIEKFHVKEDSIYTADVVLNLKLVKPSGQVIWAGSVAGRTRGYGISYKEKNYHETLCDAVYELVYTMLKNDQIVLALKTIN
jgi:hypothetical protein